MNKEENSLLLQDLCARLPYGVIVQVKDWTTLDAELKTGHIRLLQEDKIELKPYLRPMYSMSDEEYAEYVRLVHEGYAHDTVDYLNSIHVDYRCLIQKGLAIAITKENNPYET